MPKPHPDATKKRARELYQQRGTRYASDQTGIPLSTVRRWAQDEHWQRRIVSVSPGSSAEDIAAKLVGWAIRKRGLADEAGLAAAETLAMYRERVRARKVYGLRDLAHSFTMLAERADAMTAGTGGLDAPQMPVEERLARLRELAGVLEQRAGAGGG